MGRPHSGRGTLAAGLLVVPGSPVSTVGIGLPEHAAPARAAGRRWRAGRLRPGGGCVRRRRRARGGSRSGGFVDGCLPERGAVRRVAVSAAAARRPGAGRAGRGGRPLSAHQAAVGTCRRRAIWRGRSHPPAGAAGARRCRGLGRPHDTPRLRTIARAGGAGGWLRGGAGAVRRARPRHVGKRGRLYRRRRRGAARPGRARR